MKKLATIISIIFHPLLMPTIGLYLIFNAGSHLSYIPFEFRRLSYWIVFISSCVLPLSVLPLLLQLNVIKSIKMESAKERILPMFSTAFFYFIGYLLIKKTPLPAFIPSFIEGSLMTVIMAMGITFFWKISIHMIGVGGLLAALFVMSIKFSVNLSLIIPFIILISGLVGSSRLYLNAHTSKQVYGGFSLGFGVIFFHILFA